MVERNSQGLRAIGIGRIDKEEHKNKPHIFSGGSFFAGLFKVWYLEHAWEKIVFVLGFVALAWTIFERLFLGRW